MSIFPPNPLEAHMIRASIEYAEVINKRGRVAGKPAEIQANMRREMFQMVGKTDPALVADIRSRLSPQQIDALLTTITAHPIIAPVLEIR